MRMNLINPLVEINRIQLRRIPMVMWLVAIFWVPTTQADDLLTLWHIAEQQDAKYLSAEHKYRSDIEVENLSMSDLLPSLSYQYETKDTHEIINDSDNKVFEDTSSTYSTKTSAFKVNQSIFEYARWIRYSQSKISTNKALVEYKLAKQQLLLRLAENYFLVLERGDQLETVQSEKMAMKKHLDSSKKKHRSGLGRRVDMEDAEARYLNALSKEVELQSRLMDSRYALREVLGVVPNKLSILRANILLEMPSPADPQAWVDLSAKHNLELQSMNFALEVAEQEVRALQTEHFPTLDLVYSRTHTRSEGSVLGGGGDFDDHSMAVQFNMPLYSGGKTSAKIRQATEKRESIMQDRNAKRRSVERSAHEAYYRISAAIIQIEALEQSVKAQQRLLDSKTSGYRVGQSSMLEILDVEQDLSEVQQALTKARYDYVLNVLKLKFSAGNLQTEDLVSVNGWLTDSPATIQ